MDNITLGRNSQNVAICTAKMSDASSLFHTGVLDICTNLYTVWKLKLLVCCLPIIVCSEQGTFYAWFV
jgi:hypothetical protein